MGASASFEQPTLAVEPGGQSEVQLRVRNTGGVVDSFTFEAVGVPEGWVTVAPAEVRLFPETEEFVAFHFCRLLTHCLLSEKIAMSH